MIQHHPGTSEPHHLAYPFSHVFLVAVGRAFLAGSLLLAVLACRESFVSIFFKLSAIVAEGLITFLLATVQSNHQGYGILLSFYLIH